VSECVPADVSDSGLDCGGLDVVTEHTFRPADLSRVRRKDIIRIGRVGVSRLVCQPHFGQVGIQREGALRCFGLGRIDHSPNKAPLYFDREIIEVYALWLPKTWSKLNQLMLARFRY